MGYVINNTSKKISLIRGDTLRVQINIYVDKQKYTPQEGDSVRFAMKTFYNASTALITKAIPNETLILYLEPEDTKELSFGNYVYDIQITFANGDVDTFISGVFEILPEVL